MKRQAGKDMVILGSAAIVSAFARLGLIDEYRFIVSPVVLGRGKTLFADISARTKLRFLGAKMSTAGNVFLRYGA